MRQAASVGWPETSQCRAIRASVFTRSVNRTAVASRKASAFSWTTARMCSRSACSVPCHSASVISSPGSPIRKGTPRGGRAPPGVNHERVASPVPTRTSAIATGIDISMVALSHGRPPLRAGRCPSSVTAATAATSTPHMPTSTARITPSGLRCRASPTPAKRNAVREL